MRKIFTIEVEKYIYNNQKSIFITGDLGYNAFENLMSSNPVRFINAGVAEQNMIGVAAGLSSMGFEVFTYSIAPFVVFRSYEQIKIDCCIHNLPVYIIGNGGGYGYGIMGATHHSIEDISCMSSLPNMTCWIPAFDEDVSYCLSQITGQKQPAYLRLGKGKSYANKIKISAINKIISNPKPKLTIVALGPIVHNVDKSMFNEIDFELYTIIKIPFIEDLNYLIESIMISKKILVIEEHVKRGGLGECLLSSLIENNIKDFEFISLNAKGYPSKLYGDQEFHQADNGLDSESIKEAVYNFINS